MMIAMVLLQFVRASACAERIFEVIDKEPSIEDGEDAVSELPAPAGQVEFRHVNFKYKAGGSGDDVLHDINFVARPGQTVAIVGGTGVGKSSLVNLIPRFYDVTGGEVLLDGVDVRKYPVEALRKRIGMVLQNNVLFSGTIRENLLWGDPNATEEQVIQAAKDAQAYDFIMTLPRWLRHPSGAGRRQRLRRPEAAPVYCPGHAPQARRADPGRLHLRRGLRHRGRHPRVLQKEPEGHHRHSDRPAHQLRAERRSDPRAGRGHASPATAPTMS